MKRRFKHNDLVMDSQYQLQLILCAKVPMGQVELKSEEEWKLLEERVNKVVTRKLSNARRLGGGGSSGRS